MKPPAGPRFDVVTNVVGMGGIAIGVIPLFLNRKKTCTRRRKEHEDRHVVSVASS